MSLMGVRKAYGLYNPIVQSAAATTLLAAYGMDPPFSSANPNNMDFTIDLGATSTNRTILVLCTNSRFGEATPSFIGMTLDPAGDNVSVIDLVNPYFVSLAATGYMGYFNTDLSGSQTFRLSLDGTITANWGDCGLVFIELDGAYTVSVESSSSSTNSFESSDPDKNTPATCDLSSGNIGIIYYRNSAVTTLVGPTLSSDGPTMNELVVETGLLTDLTDIGSPSSPMNASGSFAIGYVSGTGATFTCSADLTYSASGTCFIAYTELALS